MSSDWRDVLEGRARWALVEGDNREVLPTLEDRSVAHVITDPPYSEWTHSNVRRGSGDLPDGYQRAKDLGFAALADSEREALAKQFARVGSRWVLAFTDNESAASWMRANMAAGLDHVRIGVWLKEGSTPQFSGDRPANGAEAVVISHRKGRKRWNGGGGHAVWSHPIVRGIDPERTEHTTQKPLSLMIELVELFTDPDEVVLDPFAGSGTTGVACLRLGRRFIGMEREPKYAALARERLEAESKGLTLRAARAGQQSLFAAQPQELK